MAEDNQIKDMSIHEASEYWDEHDFDEFGDVLEVKEFQFYFKKKKYIGVDRDLYATIKRKAKALPSSCCGRSTVSSIQTMVTATPSSVTATACGRVVKSAVCDRFTVRVRSCLSTTRVRRSR